MPKKNYTTKPDMKREDHSRSLSANELKKNTSVRELARLLQDFPEYGLTLTNEGWEELLTMHNTLDKLLPFQKDMVLIITRRLVQLEKHLQKRGKPSNNTTVKSKLASFTCKPKTLLETSPRTSLPTSAVSREISPSTRRPPHLGLWNYDALRRQLKSSSLDLLRKNYKNCLYTISSYVKTISPRRKYPSLALEGIRGPGQTKEKSKNLKTKFRIYYYLIFKSSTNAKVYTRKYLVWSARKWKISQLRSLINPGLHVDEVINKSKLQRVNSWVMPKYVMTFDLGLYNCDKKFREEFHLVIHSIMHTGNTLSVLSGRFRNYDLFIYFCQGGNNSQTISAQNNNIKSLFILLYAKNESDTNSTGHPVYRGAFGGPWNLLRQWIFVYLRLYNCDKNHLHRSHIMSAIAKMLLRQWIFVCLRLHNCDKKFREEFHLVIHSIMHSGEKSFPCSYCNEGTFISFCKMHKDIKFLLIKGQQKQQQENQYLGNHFFRYLGFQHILLIKARSVPVVVHLMKGLQKYFQTEICTDSENGSNAFNCPENQTNNMGQIFVDSENDFPNTIPHTTLLGSCIKSNVNWKTLPLRRQLLK
ncbi:unnamed protein product, partial [Meganyctiphanes norvegica]